MPRATHAIEKTLVILNEVCEQATPIGTFAGRPGRPS